MAAIARAERRFTALYSRKERAVRLRLLESPIEAAIGPNLRDCAPRLVGSDPSPASGIFTHVRTIVSKRFTGSDSPQEGLP